MNSIYSPTPEDLILCAEEADRSSHPLADDAGDVTYRGFCIHVSTSAMQFSPTFLVSAFAQQTKCIVVCYSLNPGSYGIFDRSGMADMTRQPHQKEVTILDDYFKQKFNVEVAFLALLDVIDEFVGRRQP